MSNAFTLNFRHCRSLGDAMLVATKTADAVYAGLKDLLEENRYYIPSIRFDFNDMSDQEKRVRNDAWLESLMKMNFIWWPQYKLLAFSGDGWPKAALSLYKRKVFFQNSCDQDYGFSEWKDLRAPFKEIVQTCHEGTLEDVAKMMNMGRPYPWEFEIEDGEDEEALAYYRRSAAYNGIYETLHLDQWLYGQEDCTFIRFSLSALNSQEREFNASMYLKGYALNSKI